jgi:hypothetical protein
VSLSSKSLEFRCRGVGAGEAKDSVTVSDELLGECSADVAAGASDEDFHIQMVWLEVLMGEWRIAIWIWLR